MEYNPPPLFKQGASARAKVIVFAIIAIVLLIVDARLNTLGVIRQTVGIALYPMQVAALAPRDALYAVGEYFSSLSRLNDENAAMKRQQLINAQALQLGQQLMAENAQLRKLMSASERLQVKSVLSEILYDTRDAFTRKIVVDRGSRHGVTPGQPVIDDVGVVGQVTRVFPFTSEITLLTDKNHAISVQVVRSGVRSIAYGSGQSGVLDLRFMAANADIRKGDVLVTSGIDGVYPPGLSVAQITQVENKSSDAFARVICQPSAGIDRNKQLLILMPDTKLAPRPEPEEIFDKKDKSARKRLMAESEPGPAVSPTAPVPARGTAAPDAAAAGVALTPVPAFIGATSAAAGNKPAPAPAAGSPKPAAAAATPNAVKAPVAPATQPVKKAAPTATPVTRPKEGAQ